MPPAKTIAQLMEVLNHAETTLDHGEWLELQAFVNRCVADQKMQQEDFEKYLLTNPD